MDGHAEIAEFRAKLRAVADHSVAEFRHKYEARAIAGGRRMRRIYKACLTKLQDKNAAALQREEARVLKGFEPDLGTYKTVHDEAAAGLDEIFGC